MEWVIKVILQCYENLYNDKNYNTSNRSRKEIILSALVIGISGYAHSRKIDLDDFCSFFRERMIDLIRQKNAISIEYGCFVAASLRGDFLTHQKDIGIFLGQTARKLNLDRSVFEAHEISETEFVALYNFTLMRFRNNFAD